jgi:hypothetical protein
MDGEADEAARVGMEGGGKIGIWRLLRAAPTAANILNHMQHDMHEFQVIGLCARASQSFPPRPV